MILGDKWAQGNHDSKRLRQMGISSWETWLIGTNGLKSMENMVAQGKWA
jgi:hypothetical protein